MVGDEDCLSAESTSSAAAPTLSFRRKSESRAVKYKKSHWIPCQARNDGGGRMVLTFIPLPRLRLEPADGRRRGLFERWKREFRSRPNCGAKTEGISGSGVAFSFPYFFWLSKRNRVASRASATYYKRLNFLSTSCQSSKVSLTRTFSFKSDPSPRLIV